MNWYLFWIVLYLIVIVYLTIRHVKSKDVEGYLVNNRKTKTLPLVFTTLATFVGGGTSIGLMAMGYESGLAAVGIGIAYVIGFAILSRYAGRIRDLGAEKNIYSFPEYLNRSYTSDDDRRFERFFSSIVSGVNIFIFFFLLAAQFVAMASLLEFAFEIGFLTASIISCIVVIAYTAFAGLAGVIITDMIQFVVIVFMIIVIFIPGIVTDTETFTRFNELPSSFMNGTFYGIAFLVALPLFLSHSVLVRMDIWQRILAAKDAKVAKKVSIWGGIGMLPFYIIFPLVGMGVRLTMGDSVNPNDVTFLFMDAHAGPVLLGFAVVGMLSALMSSGDSFLNLVAISTVKDFVGFKKHESGEIDKQHLQRNIRIVAIIFGIIAMVMALWFPKVVDLMVVGLATITIFVPVTYLALSSKNPYQYRSAAAWSIVSGFVVNLVFFVIGIVSPEVFEAKSSFIPAILVAGLVLIIGVSIKKRSIKKK
jgi:Na+/proline symporter